ncbi:MAG: SGNH/GDSL hydrolase family protein [Sulfuricurvum sp.]|nr:SGNH/GDSL hydrolase family protein [Sulfuricurvum sp.]
MVKRSIRLREYPLDDEKSFIPENDLLTYCKEINRQEYKIHTDKEGFILSGNSIDTFNKTTLIIGDSFVANIFVEETKRFCSILEQIDNKKKTNFFGKVLNGGYSGNTTLNIFNTLMNKIIPMKIDSLVFILPSNDSQIYRYSDTYWNSSEYYAPILPTNPNQTPGAFGSLDSLELVKLLDLLIRACTHFDINLTFGTTPCATNFYMSEFLKNKYQHYAWYEATVNTIKRLNDKMRNAAYFNHVPLIDLEIDLQNNDYFYDDVHLNEYGSQACAEIIYNYFRVKDGVNVAK